MLWKACVGHACAVPGTGIALLIGTPGFRCQNHQVTDKGLATQRHLFWLSLPSAPIQASAQEQPTLSWLQQTVFSLLLPSSWTSLSHIIFHQCRGLIRLTRLQSMKILASVIDDIRRQRLVTWHVD